MPPLQQQSYQSILRWAHENGAPGAILFVRTPHEEFLEAIGVADAKRGSPMRIDHAFRIGSVTKMFTGVVIAQLVAEGDLSLDDFIVVHLPPCIADHITNSGQITVRHLLRHQSGIYDYDKNLCYNVRRYIFERKEAWSPLRTVEYAFDRPAAFSPGSQWRYCNSNFLLAGFLIDQLSGRHHSVEIRERVLNSLGLKHTYYERYESPTSELAHGYSDFGLWQYDARDSTALVGGEAGLVSTVSDLAVFARSALRESDFLTDSVWRIRRGEPNPLLDEQILPVEFYPVLRNDFGVILNRASSEGSPWFFGHFGGISGYSCFVWYEPTHDIVASFFQSKMSISGKYDRIAQEAARALFDLSVQRCKAVNSTGFLGPEGSSGGGRGRR